MVENAPHEHTTVKIHKTLRLGRLVAECRLHSRRGSACCSAARSATCRSPTELRPLFVACVRAHDAIPKRRHDCALLTDSAECFQFAFASSCCTQCGAQPDQSI